MTKFHDSHSRPPRGGWFFTIAGELVNKHTEADIIEAIAAHRRNNGTFTSLEAIQQELWNFYCAREPERCGMTGSAAEEARASVLAPRELNPRIYGPWLWNYLALEAVHYDYGTFQNYVQRMLALIDCPECRKEWADILQADSPLGIYTAREAMVWVLKQHNRVNAKLGKPQWNMQQFVAEYGAPKDSDQ